MGRVLLGCVLGALLFALVAWSADWLRVDGGTAVPPPLAPAVRDEPPHPATAPLPPPVAPAAPAARLQGSPAPQAPPFAPGEAWLRIGEGYVFGETYAGTGARADLVCDDIRDHGATFECPGGAALAAATYSAVGMPATSKEAAARVHDAPLRLPRRRVEILTRATPAAPGVAFARAGDGVYEFHVLEVESASSALRRRAHIAYVRLPQREGGGELDLPTTDAGTPVPLEAQRGIRRALSYEHALASLDFVDHLCGAYHVVRSLASENVLQEERFLVVDAPLRETIVLKGRGGVYASRGVGPDGRVVLDSYSGLAVQGDLEGKVDVRSYGYVHIDGDLVGVVDVDSYATVIVEGDLVGTLKIRSYTDFVLRGRLLGKIEFQPGNWSDFWFDGFWTQSRLESIPGQFGAVRMHVRDSDLPAGRHEGVGTWREVRVGEKGWESLAR